MTRSLRSLVLAALIAVLPIILTGAPAAAQEPKPVHRLAVQVDVSDAQVMNLALNNITNVINHYTESGEEVEIAVVTFGPGLHMLRADSSPVKDRLKALTQTMAKVSFLACANTRRGMSKAEQKEIPLVPEAKEVPSGVVRLMELQEEGWSYIRP